MIVRLFWTIASLLMWTASAVMAVIFVLTVWDIAQGVVVSGGFIRY